jgi:TetR/AcrR family transcriptional regulator, lmrAB and yxaGH operons repressor
MINTIITAGAAEETDVAEGTRAQMVEGALRLLATKGVNGASINQILEFTGAPRGSVYYHFPGGRNELIGAALELTARRHDDWVSAHAGTSVEEVVSGFLEYWRRVLVNSHLESGCPILAVTVSTPDGELFDRAGNLFAASLDNLARLLADVGLDNQSAVDLATFLVAGAEGAVVLARAQRSLQPFETVAERLTGHARELSSSIGSN